MSGRTARIIKQTETTRLIGPLLAGSLISLTSSAAGISQSPRRKPDWFLASVSDIDLFSRLSYRSNRVSFDPRNERLDARGNDICTTFHSFNDRSTGTNISERTIPIMHGNTYCRNLSRVNCREHLVFRSETRATDPRRYLAAPGVLLSLNRRLLLFSLPLPPGGDFSNSNFFPGVTRHLSTESQLSLFLPSLCPKTNKDDSLWIGSASKGMKIYRKKN